MDILKTSDKEVLEVAYKLCVGYKMKRIMRYRTKRDATVHNESDAEHVFALIYLAHYFLGVEPTGLPLSAEKIYSLLMFHDFGEIKYGDVVTYDKTTDDKERELGAAKEVFDSLPEEISTKGYAYWQEYEGQASPEARFCFALDKIEPLFELLDPVNERSMKDLKITYEKNLSNKLKPTEEFPAMRRFVDVISKDMKNRSIFWEG
ncbi:MAG TPA: HD domain-containing protein [Candidatus Paceibacterota bacterium]